MSSSSRASRPATSPMMCMTWDSLGPSRRLSMNARLALPVLAAVAVVRDHGGDPVGRGPLESIEHEQEFHQVLVDRIATRLAEEDILPPHVLIDLHPDLAIAEHGDERVPLPDSKAIANLFDERRVRVPGEHLQFMHPEAHFEVNTSDSSRRRTRYPNLSFFCLSTEVGRRRIPLCPGHPDLPARTAIKAFGRDPSQPLVAKHPEDRRAAAGQHGCLRSAHE